MRSEAGPHLVCGYCSECDTDYTSVVREELAGQCLEDEALHPWHYAGAAKGLGYLVKPFLAVQEYCQVPCQVR